MNDSLTPVDKKILAVCARTRGLWPDIACHFPLLKTAGSTEALRKRFERLGAKGYLANTKMPNGRRIWRLSHKGVKLECAPNAFASSPTTGIAIEMLSVATFAATSEELVFPTTQEIDSVLTSLTGTATNVKVPGRFVFRLSKSSCNSPSAWRIDYWLAEQPKPAELIIKRVQVVLEKLAQNNVLAEVIKLELFGITIVVPSEGVKATLAKNIFALPTTILVLPELKYFTEDIT